MTPEGPDATDLQGRGQPGVMTGEKPAPDREPFMESVRCGFLPGIDPLKLNQLVDELEVEEFLEWAQGRTDPP